MVILSKGFTGTRAAICTRAAGYFGFGAVLALGFKASFMPLAVGLPCEVPGFLVVDMVLVSLGALVLGVVSVGLMSVYQTLVWYPFNL